MPWLSLIASNVLLASLLALVAWLVQRWGRAHAIAHILWVLVLVKLVTPPLVSVPLQESPGDSACREGTCRCEQHARTTAHAVLFWLPPAIWAIGACTTGWIAWRRWARFRRLMAHAVPAPAEWQALATRLSSELRIHPPEILAVPGQLPPMVLPGRGRPRMLIPSGLASQVSDSQRVVLVLHELIHLQRRDHWVRLLELTVSVAYWWLPVVGAIGRQLRACEELCCDAAVVARQPQARRDYARLLLDVIDFAAPLARPVEQATGMSSADSLECRLRVILGTSRETPRPWPLGAVIVGLACGIVPCVLDYDFVGGPAAARSAEREPAVEPTRSPDDVRNGDLLNTLCCPS